MNILEQLSNINDGRIDPNTAQKAKGIINEVASLVKDDPKFLDFLTMFSSTMYDMITISNKLGRKPQNIGELLAGAKTLAEERGNIKGVAPAMVCSLYTMLKTLQEEGFIRIIPPVERKALEIWDELKKTKLAK